MLIKYKTIEIVKRVRHLQCFMSTSTFVDEALDDVSHTVMLFVPPTCEERNLDIDESPGWVLAELRDDAVQYVLYTSVIHCNHVRKRSVSFRGCNRLWRYSSHTDTHGVHKHIAGQLYMNRVTSCPRSTTSSCFLSSSREITHVTNKAGQEYFEST